MNGHGGLSTGRRKVAGVRYSEGAKSEAPVSAANAPGPLDPPSVSDYRKEGPR